MSERLAGVAGLIERGIADGLHPGAQVTVWLDGELLELAVGRASDDEAMTPGHLLRWFSACKPVTAVAVAQQVQAGTMGLDVPVAEYLPGFGSGGKQAVTLRHLLTHTGGFRKADYKLPDDGWSAAVASISEQAVEPDWQPGDKAGYHVDTGWVALAAALEAVVNRPYVQHIREAVLEPCGMRHTWIGVPPEAIDDVRERLADTVITSGTAAARLSTGDDALTVPRPGGGGLGPAADLCRFYRMLLDSPGHDDPVGTVDGTQLLRPGTARDWTRTHRAGMFDHTFNATIDWGLGFIRDSKHHADDPAKIPYGFGTHASPETFGHGGWQSTVGLADPPRQLAAAVVFNGCPGELPHRRRMHAVLTTLYEDLGLVP